MCIAEWLFDGKKGYWYGGELVCGKVQNGKVERRKNGSFRSGGCEAATYRLI